MSRHRVVVRLSTVLVVVALVKGCGDADSPIAPPPPDPIRPTTVTVSPATAELTALGATIQLTVEVRDQNARVMAGATVTWTSSASSVATVDSSGLVTGVAEGVATITASAGSGQGTATITVINLARAALVALYETTDGPNWVNSVNWLTGASLGEWHGVDTDASGRVVGLDLYNNNLSGTIPPELGDLASLRTLLLSDNDLEGTIPPELGTLAKLEQLRFGGNNLSGTIPPELGDLASLRELFLSHNDLEGPIPPELGNLAKLEQLWLSGNNLSGTVPPELGDLASLRELILSDNELEDPIPPELGNLESLTALWLHVNDLSGPIPPELGTLARLESLWLRDNSLTGPIPDSLLELNELISFGFERNVDLCAPGIADFVTWLGRIETVSGPYCNESDMKVLEVLYITSGGPNWTNSRGWFDTPTLDEWYGVMTDTIGRVVALDLTGNGLKGRLPVSLGHLVHLTKLRLSDNALSGRLPNSLAGLSLVELYYNNTNLCTPTEALFETWLNGIASHEGTGVECAPLSGREFLVALYDATDGPNWVNAENWLTDAPMREWHGVEVDDHGAVSELYLTSNNLSGSIPPELEYLASLESLDLGNNNLSGPIPPELGNLPKLERLWLFDNKLSGPIPPELGNIGSLESLNLWKNALSGPIPPELGNLPKLERLSLGSNNLSGPILPELEHLASLERLDIGDNNLTGPILPELGNIGSLQSLILHDNELSGPIPPELGSLASLESLWLHRNELSGPIPPEFGNLASLERLFLYNSGLSGPIPPEFGGLTSLENVWIHDNELSGPIPPELGNLAKLGTLFVHNNNLTGPIPSEFGGMSSLRRLNVTNNSEMSGALPASMTALGLETLLAQGTDLCAPQDPVFRTWLQTIRTRRIAACTPGSTSIAYLTQAVQSRQYPVPLVAGEKALLRVFVTATHTTTDGIPRVRARFYLNGTERHVVDIPANPTPIPTEVVEHSISASANAEIPGELVQPGLEIIIEIDPEGTLDAGLGVPKRIPETGRMAIDVHEMPLFDLTVIPFLWSADPDRAVVEAAEGMAADPEGHELLWDTRTLLPIGDLDVTAHKPVLSSSNNAYTLLSETEAIRAIEGSHGYYMGMMSGPVTGGAAGLARGWQVSFSIPSPSTVAHEIGHNLSLGHAPCGAPDTVDWSFPYPDGSTGAWGYDFREGGRLVDPEEYKDLMSYCRPRWISDYHFTNALRYRLFDEDPALVAVQATQEAESLLLWGGTDEEGELFLNPAFVVDAPPALPDSVGEHQITGWTASGDELFVLDFRMPEVIDGDGSSSFVFVLPVEPGWASNLASITLSGPGGSVSLRGDTDLPMAILLDRSTGQVRGILRDLQQADAALALTPQAGVDSLDVLFSRGMPDAAAWSR